MNRHVTTLLIAANVVLAALLGFLWISPQGGLKNAAWQPPAPLKPDFAPVALDRAEMDLARFFATLDRPLFAPNRRPLAVKAAGQPTAAPDPLANLRLHGIYAGPEASGIIASVDGRTRRIRLQETVGEWTVKDIKDRTVTFARGDEVRTVELAVSRGGPPPPAAAGAAGGPAGAGQGGAAFDTKQQMVEEQRARLARRNAIRARAGLPPVE